MLSVNALSAESDHSKFSPRINMNGQVWVHLPSAYANEDAAYRHGVMVATKVNAEIRRVLEREGFTLIEGK